METQKCPNCNTEIPLDAKVCSFCGKVLVEDDTVKTTPAAASGNLTKPLVAAAAAVIGIIVMLAYRAWLGFPIYLVGFIFAFLQIKGAQEAFGGNIVEYLKDAVKNGDIAAKITAVTVASLPIALGFAIYGFVVGDSMKEYDELIDEYNSYF